ARRQRTGRGRRRRARAAVEQGETGRRGDEGSVRIGPAPWVAEPVENAVRGELADPAAAGRTRLQVLVDRFGRGIVELAQAVRREGLVGGVTGWSGVHRVGLPL